jgi:hypothetical protein
MKQFLIFGLALVMVLPAGAQELSRKEQRALEKQMKREQQAEEARQKAILVGKMVEYRWFVLEADQLRSKRGEVANVSSMINFIACDSVNGVIQIGSNSYVGYNGVGGITVEGSISNYEYSQDEKSGSYDITYNVKSSTGTYFVRMFVSADGRADATVSSTWPGRVNYVGYIVPPSLSKVYKGTSRY